MLAYLKLRKLKKVVLGEETDDDKNETAFSEMVQFLDSRSLSLIMREARDDGKKALEMLREHYAGRGKPRIISLYTVLTSLKKTRNETITDYVIRAENAANALKSAGEVVSDGLLVAMVMKGLPGEYKPFVVVMNQSQKVTTFSEFKVSLRSFEENEKSTVDSLANENKIMGANFGKRKLGKGKKKVICYSCQKEGHKSASCWKNKKGNNAGKTRGDFWCNFCKTTSHSDKFCRRRKNGDQVKQVSNESHHDHNFDFSFCLRDSDRNEKIDDGLCLEGLV